jgi:hypothetical protein
MTISTLLRAAMIMLALHVTGYAQTQVDLRAQSRSVDFSAAAATKPFKAGTALPASCTVGETFFKTDAAPGQNIYACAATDTWSPTTGLVTTTNSGPGGVEVLKTQEGTIITGRQLLAGEGIVLSQQDDTVTVETDSALVPRYTISPAAPSGACQDGRDVFTRTGGFPNFFICVAGTWRALWAVEASPPATCHVGELLYHTADNAIYGCTAANTWTRLTNTGGLNLTGRGECFITFSCAQVGANSRAPLGTDAVAGKFSAVRVAIRDTIKLGKALIHTSFGSAGTGFAVAVFEDLNGVPGSKIAGTDVNFNDLSAASFRQVTWGDGTAVLTPNVYWLGFSSEDAATQFLQPGGAFASVALFLGNLGTGAGAVKCSNLATGAGATYMLPATCGTATAWDTFGIDAPIIVSSAN